MLFTMPQQQSLLIMFYLSRAGRATCTQIAEGLGISEFHVYRLMRPLRKAAVVKSYTKHYASGYEIIGEPTIGDVLRASHCYIGLNPGVTELFGRRDCEYRALTSMVCDMKSALRVVFNRKIKDVCTSLAANELAMMEKATGSLEHSN